VLPLEPKYMLFSTPATAKQIEKAIDEYGDSYMTDLSPEELKTLLSSVTVDAAIDFARARRLIWEFQDDSPEFAQEELVGWLFSRVVAYVDFSSLAHANGIGDASSTGTEDTLESAKRVLAFGMAEVVDDIHDERITHVVFSETTRLQKIRSLLSLRRKLPRVVNVEWVHDSFQSRTLIDEERYGVDRVKGLAFE